MTAAGSGGEGQGRRGPGSQGRRYDDASLPHAPPKASPVRGGGDPEGPYYPPDLSLQGAPPSQRKSCFSSELNLNTFFLCSARLLWQFHCKKKTKETSFPYKRFRSLNGSLSTTFFKMANSLEQLKASGTVRPDPPNLSLLGVTQD